MLNTRPQLGEHVGGDVLGSLRYEDHAHALGSNEPHRLDDLTLELLRCIGEQQVGLVEEEDELGTRDVTDLWERRKQVRQQEHDDRADQGGTGRNVAHAQQRNDAPAARIRTDQVRRVEARRAEELAAALGLKSRQGAQDHPGRCLGDAADFRQLILSILAGEEGDHRTQVG